MKKIAFYSMSISVLTLISSVVAANPNFFDNNRSCTQASLGSGLQNLCLARGYRADPINQTGVHNVLVSTVCVSDSRAGQLLSIVGQDINGLPLRDGYLAGYLDLDGDGEGGQGLCTDLDSYADAVVANNNDPDDGDNTIFTTADESICNGVDNDGDGMVDEDAPEESSANNNCNDGIDNDCDGLMDSADGDCQQVASRILFVANQFFSSNLGGFTGADAKCQAAADASPLANLAGKTWKAVLWDSRVTLNQPNVPNFNVPAGTTIVDVNGMELFTTTVDNFEEVYAPLSSDANYVLLNELGQVGNGRIFYGHGAFMGLDLDCADWTDTSGPVAEVLIENSFSGQFGDVGINGCGSGRLLCVSD